MIPVYCPLCCDQPFEDQSSLYFHLRGVRNNLFCPICSEKFASLEALVSHLAKKCSGPESPLVAKRKCLSQINEEPDLPEKRPKMSPNVMSNVMDQSSGACSVGRFVADELCRIVPNNAPAMVNKPNALQLSTRAQVYPQPENGTPAKNIALELPSPNLCLTNKNSPANQQRMFNKILVPISMFSEIQNSSVNTTSLVPLTKPNKQQTNNKPKTNNKPWPVLSSRLQNVSTQNSVVSSDSSKTTSVYVANEQLNIVSPSANSSGVKCSPAVARNTPKSFPTTQKGQKPPNKPVKPNPVLPETPKTANSTFSKKSVEIPHSSSAESDFSFEKYDTTNDDTVSSNSANEGLNKSVTGTKKQESKKGKSLQNGTSFPKGKSKAVEVANKSVVHSSEEKNLQKRTSTEVKNATDSNKKTEDAKDGKEEENGGDEEYTCSACNIRFTSIYEHIKQYHNGEEVVVEVPEEELKEEVRAYQHEKESKTPPSKESVTMSGEASKNRNTSPLKDKVPSTNKTGSVTSKGTPNRSLSESKTSKKPKQPNNCKLKNSRTQRPDSSGLKSDVSKNNKPDSSSPNTSISPQVNRSKGKWVVTQKSGKKAYFQYLYNPNKNQLLLKEMKNNKSTHPLYGSTIQSLFENPKINVIEITNKPDTPYFTDRIVDLKNPIPMYVTPRSVDSEKEEMLGGMASYIIANSIPASDRTTVPRDSKVIAVMKVILASDNRLTLENIVFKEKPVNELMIPFLEEVSNPELPLLKNAKMLMWRCLKCSVTTWKFPLTMDSHCCYSCHLCHKPFASTQEIRAHMEIHKKEVERLCATCHGGVLGDSAPDMAQCDRCRLFVRCVSLSLHQYLHLSEPDRKFNCSACNAVAPVLKEDKAEEQTSQVGARLLAKHPCSECDRKFHSTMALACHRVEHNCCSLQFPCNYCDKRFICRKDQSPGMVGKRKPSAYIQKIWHEKIHTRKRPYRCAGCAKTFRSGWHLRHHAAAAHKYEVTTRAALPIFTCAECTRAFSNDLLLAEHTASRHGA